MTARVHSRNHLTRRGRVAARLGLTRRGMVGLLGAALAAPLAADAFAQSRPTRNPKRKSGQEAGKSGPGLKFFTKKEFGILDEMAEMIIPADARSGGARAAGVARYIDEHLAESLTPDWQQSWRDDLAEIDRLSRVKFRRSFLAASPKQRRQLLESISRNEKKPKEAGEYAFGTIKWEVAWVYYKSKIGIHDELAYQGNTLQDEFAGTDVSAPAMMPQATEKK